MKLKAAGRARGFSLVELLVALGVFMIVGGAAVGVISKHMPLFTEQQNQSAMNVAMRNAIAQMQMDVVNAGAGYYPSQDIPAWPIGVTIENRNGGGCFNAASGTYTANCFDTLNVIAFDTTTTPVAHLTASCATPASTTGPTASPLIISPADAGVSAATLAGAIKNGDELLVLKNDASQLTMVNVIADATVSGGNVSVPIDPTAGNGTNSSDSLHLTDAGQMSLANGSEATGGGTPVLGTSFCSTDWVLKLAPITYGVDTSDNRNPKLYRQVGGPAGKRDVLAEQIVGFKVGASLRTPPPPGCNYEFSYDSLNPAGPLCGYNGDWAAITSVRISVIGRTSANTNVQSHFRNSFDGGGYKVEGVSVVVSPRNLTMNN
jgi:type II secretory pathway pseudopilin PulG